MTTHIDGWNDPAHVAVVAKMRAARVDEEAITCVRRAVPRGLLEFQRRAIVASGLLDGRSTLLLAPTSAGKTLLAELALWRAVATHRRGVYLAPTRALAEQVHADLRGRYAALGRRILLATRDHPESDAAVRAGLFDVLVAIHEKAKAYASSGDFLRGVGCVVADELHALGDAGRGEALDLLLTAVRRTAGDAPQLVALSTPGEDAAALAAWLGAETVTTTERPHPLLEGVFDLESRLFRARESGCFEERTEELVPPGHALSCDPRDHFRRGVLQVATSLTLDAARQVMIFVPVREMAQEWARELAAMMGGDLAVPRVAAAIAAAGAGGLGEALGACLRGGVAFHHAEMAPTLRTIVEDAFRAGEVRALVATSTLSQGVNLNGDVAISVPERVGADAAAGSGSGGGAGGGAGRVGIVPLGRRRFVQQGGRAGRLRASGGAEAPPPPGLSIVVAAGRGMAERLWDELVAAPVPPISPLLDGADAAAVVLHALALSGATTRGALEEFLRATWSGCVAWRRDAARLSSLIERGVSTLRADHLVVAEGDSRLEPTAQGRAAAAAGLLPATAAEMLQWIETWEGRAPDTLDALFRLAATPDGAAHAIRIAPRDRRRIGYVAALRALFGIDGELGAATALEESLPRGPHRASPATRRQLEDEGGHGAADFGAAKKALAAAAWIGDAETARAEELFAMYAGGFEQLGAHLAWLAEAAARLAEAKGLPPALWEPLEHLARRLPAGLPEHAAALSSLSRTALSRDQLRVLAREGFTSLSALTPADSPTLTRLLGDAAAQRLLSTLTARPAPLPPGTPSPSSAPAPPPPSDSPDDPRLLGTPSVCSALRARGEGNDDAAEQTLGVPRSQRRQLERPEVREATTTPILLRLSAQNPGAVEVAGRAVTLSARQYALLSVLAERAGRCVPYDTLMARAWAGAVVEQQQINQHKRGLIRRLGEFAALPADFIETRPGIGLALLPSSPESVEVQ